MPSDDVQPRLASALLTGAEFCTQYTVDPPVASVSIDGIPSSGPMTAHCHLKIDGAPLAGVQKWAAALGDAARVVACRHEHDQDRPFVSLSVYACIAETEFRIWTHAYSGADVDRLWQVLGETPDIGEAVVVSEEQLHAATEPEQDHSATPEDAEVSA